MRWLRLGLWTNKTGITCTPDRKRQMYHVFRAAGSADENHHFEVAIPVLGGPNWDEILQRSAQD
jgi:hypothetical protein